MEASNKSVVQMKDVLTELSAFLQTLKSLVPKALVLGGLLSALAMGYYFWQKPSYSAQASFILEEKSAGGGLAGLASQFGIDVSSLSSNNSIFAGDNILDIISSRNIVEKVLLSKADPADPNNQDRLIDWYITGEKLKQKKWSGIEGIENLNYHNYNTGGSNQSPTSVGVQHLADIRLKDSLLREVYKLVSTKNLFVDRLNKKGTIIQVTVNGRTENFPKIFAERIVNETILYYVGIKTSVANQNINRLERRADSILQILNAKSYQTATQQILDANMAFKSAIVPSELSQREKTLNYAIYTEIIKNLEASKMSLSSQTPVINLLDMPKYPLEDNRVTWKKMLLLVWGFTAAASFFLAFFTYKSNP